MNRRFLCAFLLVACSFQALAASPQTTPQSVSTSSSHPAVAPHLICATCGDGGGGGGTPPPPPPPQTSKITFFNVSPQNKTVEIRDSTGLAVLINPQTNTVSLSRSGVTSQISYNAALLQWSGGDSTKAAAMQARIQKLLANPKNTSMLVPGTAHAAGTAPRSSLKTSRGVKPNVIMGPGGDNFLCNFDFACDVVSDGDFGSWGNYDFGFWADVGGGGAGTSDYNYWYIWQQDHCTAKTHEAWQAVGGSAVTLAACATAETGIGALACGGAFVATVDLMASYSEDSAICESSYPGAGSWGG